MQLTITLDTEEFSAKEISQVLIDLEQLQDAKAEHI